MRNRAYLPLILAALCLCAGPAAAGTTRHDVADSLYTDLAGLPAFDSVGLIQGTRDGESFFASGTLIADEWVLTAAHVGDAADAGSISFDLGDAAVYNADDWGTHPRWNGSLLWERDLALVHLDSAVESVLPATRFTGRRLTGETLTYVGYGKTGTGLTGATITETPPQKRAGTNNAEWGFGNVILSDFDDPALDPNFFEWFFPWTAETDMEYLTAEGDSGGGVFVEGHDGEMLLAGVSSFVVGFDGEPDSDYGDWSGAASLFRANRWIDAVLAGKMDLDVSFASGIGRIINGRMIATSGTVPEPATLSLLALGGLAALRKRRR